MPEFNVNFILFIILIIRSDNTFNSTVKNRELAKLEMHLPAERKPMINANHWNWKTKNAVWTGPWGIEFRVQRL